MKRLLLSILTVGLVSAGAFAATRAYFSDQATVKGANIETGHLDIDISTQNSIYHHSMYFPQTLMPGTSTRWTSPSGGTRILGLEMQVVPGSVTPNHYEARFTFSNFKDGYTSGFGTASSKNQYTKAVEVIQLHSQDVNNSWADTDLLNEIEDYDGNPTFRSLYDLERSLIDNIPAGAGTTTLRFEFKMDADAGNQFQGDTIDMDITIGAAQVAGQTVL